MLVQRLTLEVMAPLWAGMKIAGRNAAEIARSEEAKEFYAEIAVAIVTITIIMWNSGLLAVKWAAGYLTSTREVEVEGGYEINPLLLPEWRDEELAESTLDWWTEKLNNVVFGEVKTNSVLVTGCVEPRIAGYLMPAAPEVKKRKSRRGRGS
jgi:hypothetical protein